MRRVVVTGDQGQLGWWVRQTAPADVEVVGIDVASGMDIRSKEARALVAEAEGVVHLAALIDVVASMKDPGPTRSVNVDGTRNLLDALPPQGRFVLVSSAAVYGELPVPVAESDPCEPLSPYGASKLEAERALWEADVAHGAVVRPFNIYSSRQDPSNPYTGVLSLFLDRARRGEALRIFGDGEQTRDFVHAYDVARLLWQAYETPGAHGGTFNAGRGEALTINALARQVCAVAGEVPIEHAPARGGEIRHSVADIEAARALGWVPQVGLEQGLQEVARQDPSLVLAPS
ncbi:MAG: NAD-dependent epimerase/dehydratase family protein [Thermoplasmatota archaeon]